MKIAIRDDDCCYYTNYTLIDSIYSKLNIPVSLSITPFGIGKHCNKNIFGPQKSYKCMHISKNVELCKKIKEGIKSNKYEVLLHGYTHEYKFIDGSYKSELLWKSIKEIDTEIKKGKKELECIFETNIKIYVPPSNHITKEGVNVVAKNGLNLSGVARYLNRKMNIYSILNISKLLISRLKWKRPYSGLLNYGDHKELWYHEFKDLESFKRVYIIYKKHNWNMCISTHYWELLNKSSRYIEFMKTIQFLKNEKAEFVLLSELFK